MNRNIYQNKEFNNTDKVLNILTYRKIEIKGYI